jgi:hypothetical protein
MIHQPRQRKRDNPNRPIESPNHKSPDHQTIAKSSITHSAIVSLLTSSDAANGAREHGNGLGKKVLAIRIHDVELA